MSAAPLAALHLAGLTFEDGAWVTPGVGVRIRHAHRVVAALGDEQARQLAAWLSAAVGDAPHPADPDVVRLTIDAQRALLAARSAALDGHEDFRAGLAWASHALDAIAAAALTPTPERTTP